MVTQIAPKIYAVGIVDADTRTFHGHEMSTAQGTTYNSYLIVDSAEVVLVDTAAACRTDDFLDNIREVIDPAKITAIVTNHAEPDHNGSLRAVKDLAPAARLICSNRGTESITGYHHRDDWQFQVVKTGDTMDTGAMKLTFFLATMCHWPDSMMVHVGGPDILMSNDAFGQHYGVPYRFDDEDEGRIGRLWFETVKYYANILTPYGRNVQHKLAELLELGLPLKMIAPSHGLIWRKGVAHVIEAYKKWVMQETEPRIVMAYDTMYESTRRLSEAVGEGLDAEGVPYNAYNLSVSDRSDVLTDIFTARGLLIGSPTWQMSVLPTVATLQEDMKVLRFRNHLVGAFGSCGWQKANIQIIETRAREGGFEVPVPGVACNWRPRQADLDAAKEFGRQFARAVKGA